MEETAKVKVNVGVATTNPAPAIDLSGHYLVSIEDVARLFGKSVVSVKTCCWNGTFPIRPKAKRPYRWSSVELREWFEDGRKRA
jgi:hypothetical protein